MIVATARVLRNVIELDVGGVPWLAKPVPSMSAPIARTLSALFSTVYETFIPSAEDSVHSTVSYGAKKDEILIQVGETKWKTRSSMFGPMRFEYGGTEFEVHEKLTGRFWIQKVGSMVANGQLGFRSCKMEDYPPELESFLADLALGYLIRTLFWEMIR